MVQVASVVLIIDLHYCYDSPDRRDLWNIGIIKDSINNCMLKKATLRDPFYCGGFREKMRYISDIIFELIV